MGKTYYPEIKDNIKYFNTGTRIHQCIKLQQDIPIHIYKFGRRLRIQYDSQPTTNLTTQDNK